MIRNDYIIFERNNLPKKRNTHQNTLAASRKMVPFRRSLLTCFRAALTYQTWATWGTLLFSLVVRPWSPIDACWTLVGWFLCNKKTANPSRASRFWIFLFIFEEKKLKNLTKTFQSKHPALKRCCSGRSIRLLKARESQLRLPLSLTVLHRTTGNVGSPGLVFSPKVF